MAPAALGTDTGGSVRQPASFCGVTGIKPTYGRVSRYGLIAYGSSLDSVGVLARTAEDAEIIFRLMAGFDERDATSSDVPVADAVCGEHTSIKGLRIGVPKEYFIAGIQPEVESAVREAIKVYEELGAEIVEISPAAYRIRAAGVLPDRPGGSLRQPGALRRRALRAARGRRRHAGHVHADRAGGALAPRSSGASCWAPTRFRPAITTPITGRRRKCAP